MAQLVPAPCRTVTVVGLAEIEKSLGGGGGTITVTEALCVAEPSVPVTVTVYVPGGSARLGETVRVDDPPAVTATGLRVGASPFEENVTLRLIVPAVPVTSAVLTVLVPDWPSTTVRVLGLAAIEKSDVSAALTLTNTSTMWQTGPSVPTASMPWRPTGTAGPTVMVIVEPPPAVIDDGLKVAVRPGSVERKERATVAGVPTTVVLIAAVMLVPWTVPVFVGLAEIVKSQHTPNPWSATDWDPPGPLPVPPKLPTRSPPAAAANPLKPPPNIPSPSAL